VLTALQSLGCLGFKVELPSGSFGEIQETENSNKGEVMAQCSGGGCHGTDSLGREAS